MLRARRPADTTSLCAGTPPGLLSIILLANHQFPCFPSISAAPKGTLGCSLPAPHCPIPQGCSILHAVQPPPVFPTGAGALRPRGPGKEEGQPWGSAHRRCPEMVTAAGQSCTGCSTAAQEQRGLQAAAGASHPQEGGEALPIVADGEVVWAGTQHLQDLLIEFGFSLLQGEVTRWKGQEPCSPRSAPWLTLHCAVPSAPTLPHYAAQTGWHSPGSRSASHSQRSHSRTALPAPCRYGWPPPTSAQCRVSRAGRGLGTSKGALPLLQGSCSLTPVRGAGRAPGGLQQGSLPAVCNHAAPARPPQPSPLWGVQAPHISPEVGAEQATGSCSGCRDELLSTGSQHPARHRATLPPSWQRGW